MNKLKNKLIKEFSNKDYAHAYMNSHQSSRIATQIKVLREQRGLTQKQLAELSGIKQERLSLLEDVDYDSWTVATLRKLAHAFDTTLHISFIPFSQGIQDIEDFSREHLQVESREINLEHFKEDVGCKKNQNSESKFSIMWEYDNNTSIPKIRSIQTQPVLEVELNAYHQINDDEVLKKIQSKGLQLNAA
nr:helix-turn-helix transcriptional regulator [Nitrosomonas nitrosa]